jgi:hypothetical protein
MRFNFGNSLNDRPVFIQPVIVKLLAREIRATGNKETHFNHTLSFQKSTGFSYENQFALRSAAR